MTFLLLFLEEGWRGERLLLLVLLGAVLEELAGGGGDALAGGLGDGVDIVESLARLLEHVVHTGKALGKELHALYKRVGALHHLLLVLHLPRLLPGELQHAQRHVERLAAGDDDALVVGFLP